MGDKGRAEVKHLLLLLLLSHFSHIWLCATAGRTRLPHPWDSPGKNTGVGCHFLQCMKVKSETEVVQSYLTLNDPMDCSLPDSSIHGIFQATVLEWGAIAFSQNTLYWTLNSNQNFVLLCNDTPRPDHSHQPYYRKILWAYTPSIHFPNITE